MSTSTESVQGIILFASTSHEAWSTLASSYASQSTTRAMQIRGALNKVKKLDSSVTTYFNKVKSMSDTLTSIGEPLRPAELTGYLMNGLDEDYDALVQIVSARALTDPMHVRDIYAQMFNTEQRMEGRKAKISADVNMSAHYSARSGGGGKTPYQPSYRPDPHQQGKPSFKPSYTPSPSPNGRPSDRAPHGGGSGYQGGGGGTCPTCQICSKVGHVASCCFKRFQCNFLGAGNDGRYMDKQIAAFSATSHGSTPSYPVDPSWYADTDATDHLTNELDK
ncbi:uncharacterized protein [Lolium perenne]|uniref:uncharacterized protein n=1 Tax=Lolium perenne TaxID=4522 RepID=UPI003A99885E